MGGGDVCLLYTRTLIDELQRIRSLFKIVGGEPAQLSTMKMNSSRLGVGMTAISTMGRWTGENMNRFKYSSFLLSSFWPRYSNKRDMGHGAWGHDLPYSYLSSLPDLATPRWHHGCSSFLTSSGERVKTSTCYPCFILLYLRLDLLHLTSGPCKGSAGLGVSSFLYVSWWFNRQCHALITGFGSHRPCLLLEVPTGRGEEVYLVIILQAPSCSCPECRNG